MILPDQSSLLFIGDSITDCGRSRPVGELGEALGKGYVGLVDSHLAVAYPERHIRVANVGIGGNTIRDLKARWQSDVLDLKPDYLSIMVGINDLWLTVCGPILTPRHVPLEEYEATLDELVKTTLPSLRGLILMSPFYIESNRADALRVRTCEYGAAVCRVAARHGALFVDTQAAFDRVLAHRHPATLTGDRVHPNPRGHMILAKAVLAAIEG